MATKSIISLRGFAEFALTLMFICLYLCEGAGAQSVVATGPLSAVAAHPATFETIWDTAISSNGDLFLQDFQAGAMYEFPAGGGAMNTIIPVGGMLNGWTEIGVGVNPATNDVLTGNNWAGCFLWDIPYDPVTKTWDASKAFQWGGAALNAAPMGGGCHPGPISFNASGVVAIGNENSFDGIIEVPAAAPGSTEPAANSAVVIASGLKGRPRSLALDNAGNIYFFEDGGAPGVLMVAAGVSGLTGEASMTRVDPMVGGKALLAAIDGVSVDANGNVYISDSAKGVYLVPNENGTPNPSDAVLMAAIPATAGVDFDVVHGIMYVPTTSSANGGWTSPSGVTYNDVVAVALSNLNLGSSSAFVQGTSQTINFGFAGNVTPASFVIVEPSASTPDFVISSGGSCAAGTAYAVGSTCTVNVALDSHTTGNVSGTLEMLDANSNVLASFSMSGIGLVPAVVSGPPTAIATHPASWGQVWETAISSKGDLVLYGFEQGGLYEFPAGGGAMITVIAPGNGWTNIGVAIDPWDNLWIVDNWSAELIRVPYSGGTWNLADPGAITYQYSWGGGNQSFNTALGNWFQAAAITAGSKITNGTATIVISAESSGTLYSASIDASGNVTNGATVIASTKARAKSIAIDNDGNIYFTEDGGVSGVVRVPAGTTNLANDKKLTRVDPNLANPGGVAVDAAGNVYVGDNNNGVYLVPNENGNPNPSDAYLLTAVPAFANVDFDYARGIMYIPTKPGSWGGWNGINDVAAVALSNVNLGSVATGMQGTATPVSFGFSAGVTPASIAIEEAGSKTPDFAIASGGTCATGTAYTAQSACTVNVVLSPQAVGGVSGKLVMLDAKSNPLASMTLNGIGQGAAVSITPAIEIPIGAGLNMPGEVAADAAGNTYVADAGLKQVLMYPAGATASTSGVSVGTGLKAPTGVAVDGAGDVFIADSGKVYEVPNTVSGLNASGQLTLKSGLGTKLNLAADALGDLYIADPDNARVVKLINAGVNFGATAQIEADLTGFTAPSVVAVDGSNNLYLVDSTNLVEVQTNGTQTTLVPSLGAATGLAVDASGAVYAGMSGGSLRIPFVSGALNPSAQTTIAASVTNPTGLAFNESGNVFLADGTTKNLLEVSTNGVLNLGSPALGASSSLNADLLNFGNSPLTVTGFLSSDAVDFSATGCANAVPAGASCTASVTMGPMGPGVQGSISTVIAVQGNAANAPVVDASGIAAALAASKTTISVSSSANSMSIPVTISVASASGSGVTPTGNVILSVDGVAGTPTALSGGTVTITLSAITAGTHTFSVQYIGDRVYGSSAASASSVVGKAIPLVAVPNIKSPAYVLFIGNQNGTYVPYDGSLRSYYMSYVVTVSGATGLVPTGTLSFMQGTSAQCGTFTLDAVGSATFQPGCLEITTNTNIPNEVTPQTITSIVYSGDANYAAFTATTTANGSPISFLELRQPSVLLSPNPGAVTVPAATYPATGSASKTLTITSVLGFGVSTNSAYPSSTPTLMLNNYTLPIAFNCAGVPAHATCTFSGGNYTDLNGVLHADEVLVDTDPSKPSSITVTVTTNVSAGTATSQNSHSTPYEYAAIFGLGMLGLAFSRKSVHKKGYLVLICVLALAAATAGLTACNTTQLGGQAVLGTPKAPYAVTVTAQQVGGITIPGNNGTPITLYGSTNQISLPYTLNVTVQ